MTRRLSENTELHLWLESSLHAESELQAREIIDQKISDYRWAIKKHGIKTRIEIITSTLGLGAIVPSVAKAVTAGAVLGPVYGMVAGSGIAVAGVIAWATKRYLELEDIKRGENREIAYRTILKSSYARCDAY
jgi:hypothetical protein